MIENLWFEILIGFLLVVMFLITAVAIKVTYCRSSHYQDYLRRKRCKQVDVHAPKQGTLIDLGTGRSYLIFFKEEDASTIGSKVYFSSRKFIEDKRSVEVQISCSPASNESGDFFSFLQKLRGENIMLQGHGMEVTGQLARLTLDHKEGYSLTILIGSTQEKIPTITYPYN